MERLQELSNKIDKFIQVSKEIENKVNSVRIKGDDTKFNSLILEALAVQKLLVDPNFYVGIIGEFSCGKSTFINAFIEQRYLLENIIPGTTCSATIVCYGEENVIIHYNDGSIKKKYDLEEPTAINKFIEYKKESFLNPQENIQKIFHKVTTTINNFISSKKLYCSDIQENSKESIQDFLHKVTAVEDEAKNIAEVYWTTPIETLKNGFVIIDTPGIGSENQRHTDIAYSMAKKCDALLVLTPLQKMLSKELVDAVKNIAGDQADNCIFIGTSKDSIDVDELDEVEIAFNEKIKKTFKSEHPFYFVSAYNALRDLEKQDSYEKKDLEEFRKFKSNIREWLLDNRYNMLHIKVQKIFTALINDFHDETSNCIEKLNSVINKVQNDIIPIDSSRWNNLKRDVLFSFKNSTQRDYQITCDQIKNECDRLRSFLYQRINSCETLDELKTYLKSHINNDIETHIDRFKNILERYLINPIILSAKNSNNEFIVKFKQQHELLYSLMNSVMEHNNHNNISTSYIELRNTNDSYLLADKFDSEENFAMGSGLLAGAALAFVIPGVGLLLGGVLALVGSFLGFLFVSLDSKKKEAEEAIDDVIAKLQVQVLNQVNQKYLELVNTLENNLSDSFETQKKAYTDKVNASNKSLQLKKDNIEKIIYEIKQIKQNFL